MIEFTTEKFSGPLGLLLSLIESEEMDITEVNLAKIADDYVSYIKKLSVINPEELADFLVVAAKLLYIKSKALLPYLKIDEEENDDQGDLERQLRMYKEFILASEKIKELLGQENFLFVPSFNKSRRQNEAVATFSPPKLLNTTVLQTEFWRILTELEKQQEARLPEERLEPKINIEDKIVAIKQLLFTKIKINFSQMLKNTSSRTDMIVSFLAVLELAKQHELVFEQDSLFSDIHLLSNHQDL